MRRRSFLVSPLAAAVAAQKPHVLIGEPRLVAEAPAEEKRWGHFQFPSFHPLRDGRIAVRFSVHDDAAEAYGLPAAVPNSYVSADQGRTWRADADTRGDAALLLPNGDRLQVITPRPFQVADLSLPRPVGSHPGSYNDGLTTFYRLPELPEKLRAVWCSRLAKGAAEWVEEYGRLNDPQALRYSLRGLFPIVWWGDMRVLRDGSLLAGIYPGYLEGQKNFPSNAFFYRSTDSGGSWDVRGRILYEPDLQADSHGAERGGFTEPAYEILRDTSLLTVLRTTDGLGVGPMYLSRSRDDGKTWSRPLAFTRTGVLPRLLLLRNGVLVLSSGRPGVDLRFSFDGRGERWTEPYTLVPVTSANLSADSCGYTSLHALNAHSFLIAYSWFKRPGADGREHKAILVRRVEVG
ncbi:MAG TPA: sialidase family protein [Bryobacteraceae bacterium]|nr:sialidase family protein [Bryobacteraceae bacterium]